MKKRTLVIFLCSLLTAGMITGCEDNADYAVSGQASESYTEVEDVREQEEDGDSEEDPANLAELEGAAADDAANLPEEGAAADDAADLPEEGAAEADTVNAPEENAATEADTQNKAIADAALNALTALAGSATGLDVGPLITSMQETLQSNEEDLAKEVSQYALEHALDVQDFKVEDLPESTQKAYAEYSALTPKQQAHVRAYLVKLIDHYGGRLSELPDDVKDMISQMIARQFGINQDLARLLIDHSDLVTYIIVQGDSLLEN